MNKVIFLLIGFLIWNTCLFAQTHSQTIRGTVIDKDAKTTLIGANVAILSTSPVLGTSTDYEGDFKVNGVPVGRHNIQISYLGYETVTMTGILLNSGKELVLNIELVESTAKLDEVVVTAKHDKTKPLNEMATLSARSFSVEETSRYAASYFDPARMAQNYAGVSLGGGTDDIFNEIIVRGNSPRGVLWRLEGIEIPNPNHFGSMGSSGGAISMLSSTILTNSDFYTGAFPAEFGNASSGVFDLRMRNGNNEKREYAFMLGALGVEAAAEGPFMKGHSSSYLINYRYSTLALLQSVGLNPVDDILPEYQDLSFKINLPTQNAGTFGLFGLGGANVSSFTPEKDSTKWITSDDKYGFVEKQKVGTIGLSHRLLLSETSYLRTVIAASNDAYEEEYFWFDNENKYQKTLEDFSTFQNRIYRISTSYTNKLNARNTVQLGAIAAHYGFDFEYKEIDDEGIFNSLLDNKGNTQLYQAFVQWRHRMGEELIFNTGIHYTYFALNGSNSLEPRLGVKWQFKSHQSLSAAIGIHSKPEHVSFYFVEGSLDDESRISPNKELDMLKSLHAVMGYEQQLGENFRLTTEVYYQHLYDVPVEKTPGSTGSVINAQDVWDIIGSKEASNDGKGRNYGVDITLEKFFSQQYYALITTSLYQSKYTPIDGREYNTRYNSNYQINFLGGKEFKVGRKKNNIIGFNGKLITAGGNRYTPIDIEASRLEDRTVRIKDQRFEARLSNYFRFDFGFSYRINRKQLTHSILIDIQNLTNKENPGGYYYDREAEVVKEYYQTGLFPVFNYRIEF